MSIGKGVARIDGLGKATGALGFCADVKVEGLWHGAIVRADQIGFLAGIDLDPGFDWGSVVVVRAGDIPGENAIHIIEPDMPCLASDRVEYVGEPVALVAAPTPGLARRAAARIRTHIDPLPGVFGIEEIARRYREGEDLTVFVQKILEDGDVGRGFARSDTIVEGEYRTGPQEHAYIETQAMTAIPVGTQGMRLSGSLQCPYYVRPAVAAVLGMLDEAVVIEQAPTGGAFGGKEDFPSLLACHASLLALRSGHPVRIVLEREEDISFTTKRHASWTWVRTGTSRSGTLVALKADIILDAGAYVTLSPVVLSRALLHACGPYRCPNVRIRALAVKSNMPPSGAFRGFGAPQAQFAIESHMDEVAVAHGLSPDIVRLRNILKPGARMATGQVLTESVGGDACLESVTRRCEFERLRTEMSAANRRHTQAVRWGIGLATFMHGAGFTGSGEKLLGSRAGLRLGRDGTVDVLTSITDMGQGSLTIFAQIVAGALDLPLERISCRLPDTSRVPDSGPTVASRSTMIVGRMLWQAAGRLVERMREILGPGTERRGRGFRLATGETLDWDEASRRVREREELGVEVQHEVPAGHEWDEDSMKGTAYPVFSWGAAAAEVEVDTGTLLVTPTRLWLAYEVGKALNPVAARGQLEGGSLQALGWALLENLSIRRGRYLESRLQTYIVPTSMDCPEVDLEILEIPYSRGPAGAKGLGELPMNGVAAALRNAVRHALGRRVDEIPMTPERLFDLTRGGEP